MGKIYGLVFPGSCLFYIKLIQLNCRILVKFHELTIHLLFMKMSFGIVFT